MEVSFASYASFINICVTIWVDLVGSKNSSVVLVLMVRRLDPCVLASRSLKKIGEGCFTFDAVSGILSEIFCPNGYLLKLGNFC